MQHSKGSQNSMRLICTCLLVASYINSDERVSMFGYYMNTYSGGTNNIYKGGSPSSLNGLMIRRITNTSAPGCYFP